MGTSAAVVQQAYEAFGKGDIPALLELVADEVDWELIGPKSLSYAGRRRNLGMGQALVVGQLEQRALGIRQRCEHAPDLLDTLFRERYSFGIGRG